MIKRHGTKIIVGFAAIVIACILPIMAVDFAYDNGALCFISPGLCRVEAVEAVPIKLTSIPNLTLPPRTLVPTPSQWPTPTVTPEEEDFSVRIVAQSYFARIIQEEDCGRNVYAYNDVAQQYERRFSRFCNLLDPYENIFEGMYWDEAADVMAILEVEDVAGFEELGLWDSHCPCMPYGDNLNEVISQKLAEDVTATPTPEDDSKDV